LGAPRSKWTTLIGAAANWSAFMATLAVAFFLTPLFVNKLGTAKYDIWCVVEAVLTYFTMLDLGVAACLVRVIAGRSAKSTLDLNRMVSSCLFLFLAAGVIALVVGLPVLWGLSGSLEQKVGANQGVWPFMVLMLANVALTLPLSVFPAILEGLEAFTTKSIIRLVSLVVRTIGLVWCAQNGGELVWLAVVYMVTLILEHLAMAVACRILLPGLQYHWRHIHRDTLRQVRLYSLDAFLAMVASRVSLQTGAIVVGLMLPTGQVTFFATAMRLVEYAKGMLRTLTATLSPNVSGLQARGEHAAIAKLFLKGTTWALYATLPVQFGLLLFGSPFLARWVGPDFIQGAFPSLAILSWTVAPGIAQSVASRILYGTGELKWFARAALAEAAINIALLFLLIHPLGLTGAAWAVTIPNLLNAVFVVLLTRSLLKVPLLDYAKACVAPLLFSSALAVAWWAYGPVAADYVTISLVVGVGLTGYAGAVVMWEWLSRREAKPKRVHDAKPKTRLGCASRLQESTG
jgi:O-antigen/teichoic acid export membrane protein